MRREGFELAISKPQVIQKEVGDEIHEPYEQIVIDVEDVHQGSVIEELGPRKAELKNMEPDGKGRVKLEFMAPSRGIIGFRLSMNFSTKEKSCSQNSTTSPKKFTTTCTITV
jgi:GTP-binding protein